MIRPRKLKRPKMGVREPELRVFPVHRAHVKRHSCSIPGCKRTPIEFAHVKTRGSGGHDAQGVSFCTEHHVEQHTIGIETIQRKYGVDLYAVAANFARNTTDRALREAIREARLLDPVPAYGCHEETAAVSTAAGDRIAPTPETGTSNMTNTPAGQDPSHIEEKGDSATVALANAAGRGTPEQPSAEAMEAARRIAAELDVEHDATTQAQCKVCRRVIPFIADAIDALAARRVEQAVAQERERIAVATSALLDIAGGMGQASPPNEMLELGPGKFHQAFVPLLQKAAREALAAIESGRPKP